MFTGSPIAMAWGATFTLLLVAACVSDVRTRKIPNALVAAILVGGVAHGVSAGEVLPSLARSAMGLVLGFGIWIAFYVAGAIGAADVKFFAAAGAWLGPAATWRAALIAGLAGGVLALVVLTRERRLFATLRRILLAVSSRSASLVAPPAGAGEGTHRPLPYGVALAVGALAAAWLPPVL
jgi:prepilin peptidase CpaA